jgi:DNA-directed RNA polymerase subunit RPC12/RpoP
MTIRFSCPTCQKALKAPDNGAGRKIPCPQCGQRLMIPPTEQTRNKTVLGRLSPDSPASSPSLPPGVASVNWSPGESNAPPPIRRKPQPDEPDGAAAPDFQSGAQSEGQYQDFGYALPASRPHSALGITSFVIAFLVGGLNAMLAVIIFAGVARAAVPKDGDDYPRNATTKIEAKLLGGAVGMTCLNCMSVPLCLVGLGLAVAALVAHRDQNNLFSWLGLLVNGAVILGVLLLFVWGQTVGG